MHGSGLWRLKKKYNNNQGEKGINSTLQKVTLHNTVKSNLNYIQYKNYFNSSPQVSIITDM